MLSLSSQAVVLGAAMAVSSTVFFLSFTKHKSPPPVLRSCLSSEEKRKEKLKKKKKVKFAESVKDTKGNGKEYRRREKEINSKTSKIDGLICRNDINKMPANRIALYNGVLRDRVQRVQRSF